MSIRNQLILTSAALFLASCDTQDNTTETTQQRPTAQMPQTPALTPDWQAISDWPAIDSELVEAIPDPNRQMTVIILDDSSSMGLAIEPAKLAVISALEMMNETDRIALIALNRGLVLEFMNVAEARIELPMRLNAVESMGGTPLTRATQAASQLLANEATHARAFGTYRMIVTTDGQANNAESLAKEIEHLAVSTPIQITTIGINLNGDHVLRRHELGSFVDIGHVDQLADALQVAIAENQNFESIVSFEDESHESSQ